MGLDLTIRKQHNFTKDEKGRNTWTVTELGNLRNCWNVLEEIQNYEDLNNCTTVTLYGNHFHEILENMKNDVENIAEHQQEKYKSEIQDLEDFLTKNEIQNDDTQDYQVHAWW